MTLWVQCVVCPLTKSCHPNMQLNWTLSVRVGAWDDVSYIAPTHHWTSSHSSPQSPPLPLFWPHSQTFRVHLAAALLGRQVKLDGLGMSLVLSWVSTH